MATRNTIACALGCFALCLTSSASADFNSCSNEQINTIIAAASTAQFQFLAAGRDLDNIRSGGESGRFEEWFGPATTERVDTVESVLYAAWQGGMTNANYYCGPTLGCLDPTAVAWTEHASALAEHPTYGVYLCGPFWTLSNVDQAGILIHEYTHLYGTRDFTNAELNLASEYEDIARAVAANDPDAAVTIAYNYGFYCSE